MICVKSALISIIFILSITNAKSYRHVVLIHGILSDDAAFQNLKDFINQTYPGRNVTSIKLLCKGKSLIPMWDQVDKFAQQVREIAKQSPDGIDVIGYSQGGLIGRGIVESIPDHNIHTFISLSSPQLGEYGFPEQMDSKKGVLSQFQGYVQWLAYSVVGQFTSVGGYWKDPNHLDKYKARSTFLPFLNNEVVHPKQKEFKENFLKLKRLVLLGSLSDEVIKPWESSIFGFYNSRGEILHMEKQEVYINDSFGLRTLDERKAVHRIVIPGVTHGQWVHDFDLYRTHIYAWLS